MKLNKLSVTRFGWKLNDLIFQDVNLIVGKNAVGKSRTIEALDAFVKLLLQQWYNRVDNSSWKIELDGEKTLSYYVCFSNNTVVEESIKYEGEDVLRRKNNKTEIKSFDEGLWSEINPPADKLVLHVRRDTKEYPYLEHIVKWAENTYGLKFGKIIPGLSSENDMYDLFSGHEPIASMFELLNDEGKNRIIESFRELEYKILEVKTYEVQNIIKRLKIKEEGVNGDILETGISQGMLRSLYLLIFIEYIANKKEPQMLVIDDLCEGLDYQRATALGKMVFSLCKEKNIQLIATSNDGFLMDVVDIDYWNVLQREGSIVTGINKINSPKLFEDFKFTGLSNFDFFSSDYLGQNQR